MAELVEDAEKFFAERVSRRSRVLLINPPVQERRYNWIRWNQPSDMLRLASWLRGGHTGVQLRFFDFMLPDEAGAVPKQTVKEERESIWHFGRPFEEFEKWFRELVDHEGWVPTYIVVTSLTSYWHVPIEKLLNKICTILGRKLRPKVKLCLYGNYPRFEREHAELQWDADYAFVDAVDTRGHLPAFDLYQEEVGRLPNFFGLDIEDKDVGDHLRECARLRSRQVRKHGGRLGLHRVAFFNDDVCGPESQLEAAAEVGAELGDQLRVEGIVGLRPASIKPRHVELLEAARFRSLFLEHERLPGGGLDEKAYTVVVDSMLGAAHSLTTGVGRRAWPERKIVTGFVYVGLPDDDMDQLVRTTLRLNQVFQSVILKPFGYSPSIDKAGEPARRSRWAEPRAASPQWFPYVGQGSALTQDDYRNLMRWQNVINTRVKGLTFDFLDEGRVAKMVRETLVMESWKRRPVQS